jgi:hypothetical protein
VKLEKQQLLGAHRPALPGIRSVVNLPSNHANPNHAQITCWRKCSFTKTCSCRESTHLLYQVADTVDKVGLKVRVTAQALLL